MRDAWLLNGAPGGAQTPDGGSDEPSIEWVDAPPPADPICLLPWSIDLGGALYVDESPAPVIPDEPYVVHPAASPKP